MNDFNKSSYLNLSKFFRVGSTQRKLVVQLLYAQLQPLRFLFYLYLPSLIIDNLHLPWQSSVLIFNFLPILVLANVGYIAFLERHKQKEKGRKWFIHWLMLISIGIFTVEFIGLFAHTMISFYEGHPPENAKYWNVVATVFTGLGGVILEINYFFSEKIDKWIFNKVNPKYAILAVVGFTIIIASLSLSVNPQVQTFFKFLLQSIQSS